MSASASSTFMWPGMRPATGWMANFTVMPALLELVVQLAHLVLGLGHRHAVAGDDDDQARLFEDLRRAFEASPTCTACCSPSAFACCTWPKAPNSTLVNERFIALHMMMERIRPLDRRARRR